MRLQVARAAGRRADREIVLAGVLPVDQRGQALLVPAAGRDRTDAGGSLPDVPAQAIA